MTKYDYSVIYRVLGEKEMNKDEEEKKKIRETIFRIHIKYV